MVHNAHGLGLCLHYLVLVLVMLDLRKVGLHNGLSVIPMSLSWSF